MPKQNVTSFSFKLLNLVFLLQARLKSPFLSCQATLLLLLEGCTKSPFFSRMNNHNSLRLSSEKRCSSPLINFVALLWTHSKRPKIWHPRLQKKLGYLPKDYLHNINDLTRVYAGTLVLYWKSIKCGFQVYCHKVMVGLATGGKIFQYIWHVMGKLLS